jgi:hypothetical protein
MKNRVRTILLTGARWYSAPGQGSQPPPAQRTRRA